MEANNSSKLYETNRTDVPEYGLFTVVDRHLVEAVLVVTVHPQAHVFAVGSKQLEKSMYINLSGSPQFSLYNLPLSGEITTTMITFKQDLLFRSQVIMFTHFGILTIIGGLHHEQYLPLTIK